MKKQIKIAILCLSLIVGGMVSPAQAGAAGSQLIVRPMFSNINSFINSFDINKSTGEAMIYSYISVRNADMATVSLYLEKYNNGSWTSIKSWSGVDYDGDAYTDGSWYVPKGYQYRIRSTGSAYSDGKLLEMTTYTSYIVTY